MASDEDDFQECPEQETPRVPETREGATYQEGPDAEQPRPVSYWNTSQVRYLKNVQKMSRGPGGSHVLAWVFILLIVHKLPALCAESFPADLTAGGAWGRAMAESSTQDYK
jgi:hypothetical protein